MASNGRVSLPGCLSFISCSKFLYCFSISLVDGGGSVVRVDKLNQIVQLVIVAVSPQSQVHQCDLILDQMGLHLTSCKDDISEDGHVHFTT